MAIQDSTKFMPTSAGIGRGNAQAAIEAAPEPKANAKRIFCSVFVLFILYALGQADSYLNDKPKRGPASVADSRVVEEPGLFAKLFCTGHKRSRYCSY